MSGLVQYVLVRGDLLLTEGWPVGAVLAQACHAATAAIHLHYTDPHTQEYLTDLDNMHKVRSVQSGGKQYKLLVMSLRERPCFNTTAKASVFLLITRLLTKGYYNAAKCRHLRQFTAHDCFI